MTSRPSIREFIQNAPDPVSLRLVWDTVGTFAYSDQTRRQWENETYLRACDFVRVYATERLWVYNTLFTFLRSEQRQFLRQLIQRLTRQDEIRTQRPAPTL